MVMTKEGKELAPVMYWSPLTMLDEMDRMLRDRTIDLDKLWWPSPMAFEHRIPAIDIRETDDKFILEADLPGMAKEDVSLEIGDGVLEITAKKEKDEEVEEEGYIRKERGTMYYHRRLALPDDVDTEQIKARMNDGVLQIELPKMKKAEPQKMKVDVD